jgi:hypothetical protein
MGGLAAAIALASLCILAVPAGLGAVLGDFALRKWSGVAGALLGAVVGAVAGVVAVAATFYESAFDPPLAITFEVPPGYRHDDVILLEDPSAAPIPWSGLDVPFSSPSARLPVDRGGVVRVRSLLDLSANDRRAFLPSGEPSMGFASLPAPPGLSATSVVVFDFAPYGARREPALPYDGDPAALAAQIAAREAED